MKVRVIKKCYIRERVQKIGTVIDLLPEDTKEGKLPSWAELASDESKASGKEEKKPPETLHEMAKGKSSKVAKPSKKGK